MPQTKMATPAILPAEATPLDVAKKRKHSQVIDLTGDDDQDEQVIATDRRRSASANLEARHQGNEVHATNGSNHEDANAEITGHRTAEADEEDSEEEEMDESFIEDLIDQIEANPYIEDGGLISREKASEIRAHLRQIGPHQFFETAANDKKNFRTLGCAFGLDPKWFVGDDDLYLRIFGMIIVRFFMKRKKLSQYNTIDDAAALLQRCSKIMVITGAGISTSLGIPDFRSKHTGFYEKLRDMGYDEPQDVFDLETFDEKPEIFYGLAGDILPVEQKFSPTHGFIRLLQDKQRLQTNYTQNIDNIEANAGIDPSRVIQCHGSFATATCRKCKYQVKGTEIFGDIRAKNVAKCKRCIQTLAQQPKKKPQKYRPDYDDSKEDDNVPQPGIMKPDITFFGEQLPTTFFDRFTDSDAHTTDLVIVIGTSLKVAPVSEMPNHLPHEVPHIYISREPIQHVAFDIQLLGNCDDVVWELCRRAGWELKHEMVPEDLEVEVQRAGEEEGHLWSVRRKEKAAAAET